MIDNRRLVLSITTYPKRLEYFRKAFVGLMRQTYMDRVDVFSLNLDDNIKPEEVALYDEFAKADPRVEIKLRDSRWRSANKLVWTYKDYGADSVIVCFDDDKDYPVECLRQLCDAWENDKDCIIAQEINPSVFMDGRLMYLNAIDVKLGQLEFGKYLSNACLFPPGCFTEDLYNYDGFKYVTEGTHDELWFWIVSTMNGVRCVGLDNTFSYEQDGVAFEYDDSALTHINADLNRIKGYNDRLNERFGARLASIVGRKTVDFRVRQDNVLAVCSSMRWINSLYRGFNVRFVVAEGLAPSWINFLRRSVSNFRWSQAAVVDEGRSV